MRLRTILIFLAAVIFGAIAVAAARIWIEGERTRLAGELQNKTEDTIVVASRSLRFGDLVQSQNLNEILWPANAALPPGAFRTREDLLKGGDRYVMSAIEANEPVLAWKITGPGQRATLSAAIEEGMKAVTIRVDDILGVAGFVLPGDRVDVLLTRNAGGQSYVDVLLQGVKVLAVDQIADDRRDQPTVAKAVTFEVSTTEAQKLTLAATVGRLSLALRNVASAKAGPIRRVTVADLSGNDIAENLKVGGRRGGRCSARCSARSGASRRGTIGCDRRGNQEFQEGRVQGRSWGIAAEQHRESLGQGDDRDGGERGQPHLGLARRKAGS